MFDSDHQTEKHFAMYVRFGSLLAPRSMECELITQARPKKTPYIYRKVPLSLMIANKRKRLSNLNHFIYLY